MRNERHIALLTATVTPPNWVPKLARTDPEVRLDDYRRAFPVYLQHLKDGVFDHLVLVENSGHDLAEFSQMAQAAGLQDRVDLLSYDGMSHAPVSDRFFAECNLLREALTRLPRLSADPDAVIWKLTGRYVYDNAAKVIARMPKGFDLYLHDMRPAHLSVVFGFVGFRAGRMAELIGRFLAIPYVRECNESCILAMLNHNRLSESKVLTRFPVLPRTRSIAAISNRPYGTLRRRIDDVLRNFKRRINPFYETRDLVFVPDDGRLVRRCRAEAKGLTYVEA